MPAPSARASEGLGGLALRVLLPVGVLIGLVARGLLGLAVSGDLPAVLAGASGLGLGENGFEERFDVGDSVHARMIPCSGHKSTPKKEINTRPLRGRVWLRGRRWAYISPHPALASQSLSASQSSRLIRLAASMNAWLSASRLSSSKEGSACSPFLFASRSRSAFSSHNGHRLSV